MADIHVLDGVGSNLEWRVVFHYPVPIAENSVGVLFSVAIINSGRGGTTILPDGDGNEGTISAAEKLSIEAGDTLEFVFVWELERSGLTNADLLAELRNEYARRSDIIHDALRSELRYFGFITNG